MKNMKIYGLFFIFLTNMQIIKASKNSKVTVQYLALCCPIL